MTKKYITTAIPYMNGDPHIGHAVDYCLADVASRYYRSCGFEVRLQAGTDEHGSKIAQKAKELNLDEQGFVDEKVAKLRELLQKLNISYTDFVRTTDNNHVRRVQKIWQKLKDHIYLAKYKGWYCVGCESYVTDKEYQERKGICPDHQKAYIMLEEENYYFRIADFKDKIREAISSDELLILPEFRKKEMLKLLKESPDVSFSRPKSQVDWGIPVPGDSSQTMYVWADALSNYLTVLGYPDEQIGDWWPATAQFVGKDILRFHAIIWPAMLFGLDLPLPKTIVSHGMILANGQKMSKSVGNVVDPIEVIEKYGSDVFRYYFLRHIDTFNDSDFTWEKFDEAYSNELANDLGNLVQRLATLAMKNNFQLDTAIDGEMAKEYRSLMEKYEFSKAFDWTWEKVQALNKKIDKDKPWELAKNGKTIELETCLRDLVIGLIDTSTMLEPFMPETAKKISKIFNGKITPPTAPLFPKQ